MTAVAQGAASSAVWLFPHLARTGGHWPMRRGHDDKYGHVDVVTGAPPNITYLLPKAARGERLSG